MPCVTFVYPCIGRFPHTRYVRSWQMQPLAVAVLAGLTPPGWERRFFDDRLEPVDYDAPADLAAISIETYTARRGFQVAAEFRRRGVPVVMGGPHATFCPEETARHADAVCVGEAEPVWRRILADAASRSLRGIYTAPRPATLAGIRPDRRIFAGKPYFRIAMVETGRGCRFRCRFCSISAFYGATHRRRPVEEVLDELRTLGERTVFFVDDNIVGDPGEARAFFRALIPLRLRWISQASLNVARDDALLDLMRRSGCMGLLVGFESLSAENLARLGKTVNLAADYAAALAALRRHGILVYGTFLFGGPDDTPELAGRTLDFAIRNRLFLAAFNHLVPFPGTPLYDEQRAEGRLPRDDWWLDPAYRFGGVVYRPPRQSAPELEREMHRARRRFYGLRSIARRACDLAANCARPGRAALFWHLNLMMRREVALKRGIPLGLQATP